MKKSATAAAIVLAAIGAFAGNAMAQEGPWLVRARAVHIDPADKSAPVAGVGAADRITVSDKTIPEVDISYFFTPNWAAELMPAPTYGLNGVLLVKWYCSSSDGGKCLKVPILAPSRETSCFCG